MRTSFCCGEDILQILALGSAGIELPVKDLYRHEFASLRIPRFKKTAAAARLGFVQQFVATREEVSVHL